jgi:hypothetical protein
MVLPAAQVFSMFQSILLSLGQFINHDNALYINNFIIIQLSDRVYNVTSPAYTQRNTFFLVWKLKKTLEEQ